MVNFHENKLWQDSYVVLMDICEAVSDVETESDAEGESVESAVNSAKAVTATIADGLSRLDGRMGRDIVLSAVGKVAIARTDLAVCWGLGILDDDTFKSLDDKYQSLTENLQRHK